MTTKKVTAFVGSGRGHTYHAAERFLANLESMGGIETDIVRLSNCKWQSLAGGA